ncbi:Cbb3-type cytochrome oxidase component FixQ [Shimia sp. SK013]|uniref:CcoQ/FixQ family Cbb3-type cytochrome c oxidase assembly chaperone n=1 Tax=Shimia sp. SK013 TaxID=1389006 RepID=UPI0006B679C1|nr:CcoQ/FixQ family Cbb3-type cytochrome c oxidase assembly chaperone [Shimia sp. SK013]KPA21032.1 Cbb3-type cytochrome oxidase component FixQ [Shimia sp. SK013]
METYSFLREFADSWMLLFLFVFFLAIVAWVFRPGSTKEYRDTADIPFRHDDKPATDKEARP